MLDHFEVKSFVKLDFNLMIMLNILQLVSLRNVKWNQFAYLVFLINRPMKDFPDELTTPGSVKSRPKMSEAMKYCTEILRELFSKRHSAYAWPFYKPVDAAQLGKHRIKSKLSWFWNAFAQSVKWFQGIFHVFSSEEFLSYPELT